MEKNFLNFKSAVYSLFFAASILFSSAAMAMLPDTVDNYYKLKSYNFVLGQVARTSGLIHNIRFYGNFTKGADKEGNRSYILDKSKDSTWNLVKCLFPSPAGHLTTDTSAAINFGQYVTDPKIIALILNYAKHVRFNKSASHEDMRNMMLEKLTSNEDQKLQRQIRGIITPFLKNNSSELSSLSASTKKKNESKVTNKNHAREDIKKQSKTLEEQLSSVLKKGKIDGKNLSPQAIKDLTTKIIKTLQDNPKEEILSIFNPNIYKGKFESIDYLLKQVKESISQEKEGLYPPYTTEQIINAFFCEKFNIQEKFKIQKNSIALIKELDDDIVDAKKPLPIKEDLLTESDIQQISQKDIKNCLFKV